MTDDSAAAHCKRVGITAKALTGYHDAPDDEESSDERD